MPLHESDYPVASPLALVILLDGDERDLSAGNKSRRKSMSRSKSKSRSVLMLALVATVFLAAWNSRAADATVTNADLYLPSVIGSDMVLQRGQPVPVWGWAETGHDRDRTICRLSKEHENRRHRPMGSSLGSAQRSQCPPRYDYCRSSCGQDSRQHYIAGETDPHPHQHPRRRSLALLGAVEHGETNRPAARPETGVQRRRGNRVGELSRDPSLQGGTSPGRQAEPGT